MQRTQDLLNLGEYSPLTIRSYLQELRYLFSYYGDIRPSQITYEDTIQYLIYLNKTLGCSRVKSKMAANSFAFFFKQVQNKSYKIPSVLFAAHSGKLPPVMQVSEMQEVIQSISNLKHKTVIILLYSTGMRLSEIANVKIEDIDSKQMRIKIISGKGKKDRYVQFSNSVLEQLRIYYLSYKPSLYLFNGYKNGSRFSPRSIQHILHKALIKAGLQSKEYSIHTIRHSFATHLVDNGADLQIIQELMGHSRLSQTIQYLHLSTKRLQQTANPYDVLLTHINNNSNQNK